jgi:hypothetical protein
MSGIIELHPENLRPALAATASAGRKGLGVMLTSRRLRARAAEFGELIRSADHPDAIRELRRQERTFTEFADNEDWLANNLDKTVRSADKD